MARGHPRVVRCDRPPAAADPSAWHQGAGLTAFAQALRSADNGATWVAATTQSPAASTIWAAATNGANVVAVDQNGKVFRSADNGLTWAAATTQPPGAGSLYSVAH